MRPRSGEQTRRGEDDKGRGLAGPLDRFGRLGQWAKALGEPGGGSFLLLSFYLLFIFLSLLFLGIN